MKIFLRTGATLMKNRFKDYSQSIAAGICILVLESFYNS